MQIPIKSVYHSMGEAFRTIGARVPEGVILQPPSSSQNWEDTLKGLVAGPRGKVLHVQPDKADVIAAPMPRNITIRNRDAETVVPPAAAEDYLDGGILGPFVTEVIGHPGQFMSMGDAALVVPKNPAHTDALVKAINDPRVPIEVVRDPGDSFQFSYLIGEPVASPSKALALPSAEPAATRDKGFLRTLRDKLPF